MQKMNILHPTAQVPPLASSSTTALPLRTRLHRHQKMKHVIPVFQTHYVIALLFQFHHPEIGNTKAPIAVVVWLTRLTGLNGHEKSEEVMLTHLQENRKKRILSADDKAAF